MKNRKIGIIMGCTLTLIAAAPVSAAETAETTTVEAAAENQEEDTAITVTVGDTEIEIANNIEGETAEIKAELKESAGVESDDASADETSDTSADAAGEDSAEKTYTLVLTSGTDSHTFDEVSPVDWKDASLTEDHGFWYISYTDAEGKTQEVAETADETAPEGDLTMWAITNVNLRSETSLDAEVATVVPVGSECKVTGILPGWYHAEYNGQEGYLSHKYVTEDQAAAQEAAAQAQAKAAAAQASQAQSYDYSGSASGNSASESQPAENNSSQECLNNGLLN